MTSEQVAELARLLDGQIERQHAIDASRGGFAGEALKAHAVERIHVGEEHDGRRDTCAHVRDDFEDARERRSGSERAFGGPLNHGSIGQGIGERHAHFENIRTRVGKRDQHVARARQVGVAGGRVRDESRPLVGSQSRECVVDS